MRKAKIFISIFFIIISITHISLKTEVAKSDESNINVEENEANIIEENVVTNLKFETNSNGKLDEMVVSVLLPSAKEEEIEETKEEGKEEQQVEYGTIWPIYKEYGTNIYLAFSLKEKGVVGTAYKTRAVKFEGYELVKIPDNASGYFKNGNIDIIYEYKMK